MTMKCKVCSHPDRKAIDRQILSSGNLSEIARKYKLGYDSVWRHKNSHIGAAAAAGVRKSDQNHGVRLLEDLDDLVITARRILRKAEEDGHSKTALLAVKECRASLVSIAQVSHAIWQAEQQQVIEVESKQDSKWLIEGFKKLSNEKQEQYANLVYEMHALSGGHYEDEEKDPSLVPGPTEPEIDEKYQVLMSERGSGDPESNPGMEINQDDFSLRPRSVPTRRKDAERKPLTRRNPHKTGKDPEDGEMTRTRR